MSERNRSEAAVPLQRDWQPEALYGADDDLPEFCRGCGEEMEDPLKPFCLACRLAGIRTPRPDESLLNP